MSGLSEKMMTAEIASSDPKIAKERPPKTMKMLSMAQAKNPMKHAFYGGFQNIAFQTGVVVKLPGDPPNQIYLRTDAKAKHPLPIYLPPGVRPPADGAFVKATCTVVGATDQQGNPYPILIARSFALPNVLEAETRRTIDLLKKEVDLTESMRKQTGVNNDIHLTGVIIGRRLHRRIRADGSTEVNNSVTFFIRQDADPTHVIPVVCDKKMAEHASDLMKFASVVSVRGQYHTTTIKIPKYDDAGQPMMTADGKPEYALNEDGKVKVRYHPYIYLTNIPASAPNNHMLFVGDDATMDMPEWINEINKEIMIRSELGKQQNQLSKEAKLIAKTSTIEANSGGDAIVTKEEFIQPVVGDKYGGL